MESGIKKHPTRAAAEIGVAWSPIWRKETGSRLIDERTHEKLGSSHRLEAAQNIKKLNQYRDRTRKLWYDILCR